MNSRPMLVHEGIYQEEPPTLDAWIGRNKVVIQHLMTTTRDAWILTIGDPSRNTRHWRRVIVSSDGIRDNATGQVLRTATELKRMGINSSSPEA